MFGNFALDVSLILPVELVGPIIGVASQVISLSMGPLAGPSTTPDPVQTGQDIGMIPLSHTVAGTYDFLDDLDDPFTDNTALTQQAYPDVYAM